jgi:hypothetical protein
MLKGTAGYGQFGWCGIEGEEMQLLLGFSEVIRTKAIVPVMC